MGAKDATEATPRATAMRDTILSQTQDAYAQNEIEYLRSLVKSGTAPAPHPRPKSTKHHLRTYRHFRSDHVQAS